MANLPASLYVTHKETGLWILHEYLSIAITEDSNWNNAAFALFEEIAAWRKDDSNVFFYDANMEDNPLSDKRGIVRIGRIIINYHTMDIFFNEDMPYDGGQHYVFKQLSEAFYRFKSLKAFL